MAEKKRRVRVLPPFIVAVVTGFLLITGAAYLVGESAEQQNVTVEKGTEGKTSVWETERGADR